VDGGPIELSSRGRAHYNGFVTVAEYGSSGSIAWGGSPEDDAADNGRVAAAAHYVVANVDPGKLGYVKLNKILWYADLEHYRWHGVSMTGLRRYERTLNGPMAAEIAQAVGRLVREQKIVERTVKVADYARREMVGLQPPEAGAVSDEQMDILADVIAAVAPLNASGLRQMTHDDRLWQEVANGDAMLVATGSVMTPRLPRSDEAPDSQE
jgi:uncharacterized phage-associated protein